jgi:hypothetical protein
MDEITVVTNPKDVSALIDPKGGSSEFEKTLVQIEADKKKKLEDTAKLAQIQEATKPKPQPLQLTYKFIGNCDCGAEATTLIVDNPAHMSQFAIAFCIKENKQLRSIDVPPLTQGLADSGILNKKEGKSNSNK